MKKILYMVVSNSKARKYCESGRIDFSIQRDFGEGIYFLESEEKCRYKVSCNDAIIKASVTCGKVLQIDKPTQNINKNWLNNEGYDSVLGVSHPFVYYVIYDTKNIEIIEVIIKRKQYSSITFEKICSNKNCTKFWSFHQGYCNIKCGNELCESFNYFHPGYKCAPKSPDIYDFKLGNNPRMTHVNKSIESRDSNFQNRDNLFSRKSNISNIVKNTMFKNEKLFINKNRLEL